MLYYFFLYDYIIVVLVILKQYIKNIMIFVQNEFEIKKKLKKKY